MNNNRFFARVSLTVSLALIVFLSACATGTKTMHAGSASDIWLARQQQLSQLTHWQLKGRIGFVSASDSGSASLYWKQSNNSYELKIVAPLGMGSVIVVGDKNGVILQSSEGEMNYAEDAQSLIWQRTGWVIPMGSLRHWILGLPSPGEDYQLDENGRISAIENEPWQVQYHRYQQVTDYELPRKLQIENPDIKIKLVIKDWQLRPES